MRRIKLAIFFVSRSLGLFGLAARLMRGRLRILCYHGFAMGDEARFRSKLFINPDTFEQRLKTLRRYGVDMLPLGEAVERLYAGTLPARATSITIDDGFHAVHKLAAPALQRHGLPATVYVTTYYVERNEPIFRLVIQYMFWKTQRSKLAWQGVPWAPDGEADLSDPAQREKVQWDCIHYGETQCSEAQRNAISHQMGELLGVPYETIETARIMHLMSPQEVADLHAQGVDIQLHTHRHIFPQDDEERAQREVLENRAALTRVLGQGRFEHFCYPSGEWSPRQGGWLDKIGVKSSTTCLEGLNTAATPRHALRRFLDGENIHPLEFEAYVSGFSELLRQVRRA